MSYKLTLEEQEVHINFDMTSKFANVYVSNSRWINKFDKLVNEFPEIYRVIKEDRMDGEVIAKTYEFPIKYLKFAKPRPKMSEEQKKIAAERLAKYRKN